VPWLYGQHDQPVIAGFAISPGSLYNVKGMKLEQRYSQNALNEMFSQRL
jgi:hypothetical protein